jgi:hemolysin D
LAANAKPPVYVARVALDRTSFLIDGHEEILTPGMSVTAQIKTGQRTVMSYLLSPLRQYAHDGLREQ